MISNIAISTKPDNADHKTINDIPASSRKPMEASTGNSAKGRLAMALPALHVSPSFLSTQHQQRPNSTDPLIRAVEAANNDDLKSGSDTLSPTSAKTSSYLKPFPAVLAPPTTPTTTNPFDAIYNNPGRWSQGAFVTAAHKRKKSRQLKFWMVIILAVLLLIGISLIVFFCYPRSPSIRVARIRNNTDDTMSMVRLQNNPASAGFNFSMEVRIKSSNYLTTNIVNMACFGYSPKQPVNVIATSSTFSDLSVPPQGSLVANSSLIISLVTPATSAAVFTSFMAGCGLVGINPSSSNTTTANITTTNGVNIPQVVDRPQNRLLFRCTAHWSVGATTRQSEFDSTLSFSCPAHLELQPNLNRTFVFSS